MNPTERRRFIIGACVAVLIGLGATAHPVFSPRMLAHYADSPDSVDITRFAERATLADVPLWFSGSWIQRSSPYYRPFSSLVFWAEYLVFGWDFQGHVIISWLLHGAICYLVYLLALRLLPGSSLRNVVLAAVAVALFNCRVGPRGPGWLPAPVAYGVVAWWPGQTDQFSLFFALLALIRFDGWLARGRGLAAGIALWLVSLLFKEMGVSLPLAAGCLVLYRRGLRSLALRPPGLAWRVVVPGMAFVGAFLAARSAMVPGAWGPEAHDLKYFITKAVWYVAEQPRAFLATRGAWLPVMALFVAACLYVYARLPKRPAAVWLVLGLVVGSGAISQAIGGNFALITIPGELLAIGSVSLLALGIIVLAHASQGPAWALLGVVVAIHLPILHVQGPHYFYWPSAFWALLDAALWWYVLELKASGRLQWGAKERKVTASPSEVPSEMGLITVALWTIHEITLESAREYANPLWDCEVTAIFRGPSGQQRTIQGFWDGGRSWRIRFSPDEIGAWSWETTCTDGGNTGLHGQSGRFQCVPYEGENPLYRHGQIVLSGDRRRFEHADGTPFFFLADTAWNGVLRARPEDWERYLTQRVQQRFTAVQFVCTQWRAYTVERYGSGAFIEGDRIAINPAFFQARDPLVDAVNRHGMVAAPVILWALTEEDPGRKLPIPALIKLARYIVARWGAHQVMWFLGGDGHYYGEHTARWREIGRAVFGDRHDRLVTMHPCGLSWVGDDLNEEDWLDFIGYQSGHGDGDGDIKWLVKGPPATGWQAIRPRPVVNIEPNYEGHPAYQSKKLHDAHAVRRASYWSLLNAYPAGITYGTNAIWVWPEQAERADGHGNLQAAPWYDGLDLPGIRSMTLLHGLLDEVPWTELVPAPELLAEQPGDADLRRFVAAARTLDGACAVVYTPTAGEIRLRLEKLPGVTRAAWFDPATGQWQDAEGVPGGTGTFTTPAEGDWVLVLGN